MEDGVQYIDNKDFRLHFGLNLFYWQYKIIPINVPPCTWIKVQAEPTSSSFVPDKVRVHQQLDHVLFTSQEKMEIPDEDGLVVSLYRVGWHEACRLTEEAYKFCLQDYGIERDNELGVGKWSIINVSIRVRLLHRGWTHWRTAKTRGDSRITIRKMAKTMPNWRCILSTRMVNIWLLTLWSAVRSGHFTHCAWRIWRCNNSVLEQSTHVLCDFALQSYRKIGQQNMHMNKIGNIYSMDKIVKDSFPI